jgi:hypothetical protein
VWSLLNALIPTKFVHAAPSLTFSATMPLDDKDVEHPVMTAMQQSESISMVIIVKDSDGKDGLVKVCIMSVPKQQCLNNLCSQRADVEARVAEPEPAVEDVDIIIREPAQFAEREADPEPTKDDEDLDRRMCNMVAMCKRERENPKQ